MQVAVDARLTRVRAGNFGDCKSVGGGVFELRIALGPGLRVYYGLHGRQIVDPAGRRRQKQPGTRHPPCATTVATIYETCVLKTIGMTCSSGWKIPHYAAEYLAQVLAEKDGAAFLIALKDVVEAGGGMGSLAGRVGLKRPSLYKILSKKGNPTLATLQEILKPLGLRVSVALDKAA